MCGLIFLLNICSVHLARANESGDTQSEPGRGSIAVSALELTIAPQTQITTSVVALPRRAPLSIRAMRGEIIDRRSERSLTWRTPARFFTINEVLAKQRGATPQSRRVQFAAFHPGETITDTPPAKASPDRSNEPFGLFTFRAPEGELWLKWRKAEADLNSEAPTLALCRAESANCNPAAARFIAIVREAEKRSGRARLQVVNERINDAIRYFSDIAQWSAPDVWSAPLDTRGKGSMETGVGDCEDYAIAKYAALRQAGVAGDDLRLILVRDNTVGLAHAVLAARDGDRWLILDNRWNTLAEDRELRQFIPLFAISENGVQLFAAPYVSMQLETTEQDLNEVRQSVLAGTNAALAVRSSPAGGGSLRSLPLVM